jgi:ketosteroid isomerase-like protein
MADPPASKIDPAQRAGDSPVVATIIALENDWMKAVQRRDIPALEQLLDEDFVLVPSASSGELAPRWFYLKYTLGIEVSDFGFENLLVRVYGDVAIVQGRLRWEASAGGRPWKGDFLITDVWRKANGRWRVTARHSSDPKPIDPAVLAALKDLPQSEPEKRRYVGTYTGKGGPDLRIAPGDGHIVWLGSPWGDVQLLSQGSDQFRFRQRPEAMLQFRFEGETARVTLTFMGGNLLEGTRAAATAK